MLKTPSLAIVQLQNTSGSEIREGLGIFIATCNLPNLEIKNNKDCIPA